MHLDVLLREGSGAAVLPAEHLDRLLLVPDLPLRSRTGWISAMLLKLATPPGLRDVD